LQRNLAELLDLESSYEAVARTVANMEGLGPSMSVAQRQNVAAKSVLLHGCSVTRLFGSVLESLKVFRGLSVVKVLKGNKQINQST